MNNSRKRLFVNSAIQGRLLARIALYWVLYHAVLWMAMFVYRYAEHRGEMLAGATPRLFGDLYGDFVRSHFSLWVCATAILPIVLFDALKFSHRVAGPLVRFQRTIESLAAGQHVGEVRLRDGDLLRDLQDAFNQYLTSLRTLQAADAKTAANSESPSGTDVTHSTPDEQRIVHELQQLQTELSALNAQANVCAEPAASPAQASA